MFINTNYLFLNTDFAHDDVIDRGRELDKVFARVSSQSYEEDKGDSANGSTNNHSQ